MATRLSDAEISTRLATCTGWSRQGGEIHRSVQLASFPAAIAFITQVGFLAEAAGHHPDIDIRWRTVTLTLTTHDTGGLSEKDFELASKINQLVG